MRNVTRIIPKWGYQEWIGKLSKMGELTNKAELETVKKGLRKVAIINIHPEILDQTLEEMHKVRLVLLPLRKIKLQEGYSSLLEFPKPGEPFSWQCAIGQSLEVLQKFKEAYFQDDHGRIGDFLGYPQCCRDYFTKHFPLNPDPVWIALKGRIKGYPECNILLRYFGPRLIFHISCSPDCKESKKIGEKNFEILKQMDKVLAEEMYHLLSSPAIWNSYHGIAQIETKYFIGLISSTFNYLRKPRIMRWSKIK